MRPTLTAFESSPDRGRGLARDMRIRWALEEVGQQYEVRLMTFQTLKESAHRARNPFGQIPTYEDGDCVLFESGAILLHIAEQHAGLLPTQADARIRAIMWMFAALNTMEPSIFDRSLTAILERNEPWFEQRLATLDARVSQRLGELSRHLGDAPWLDGDFSAADVLMVTVLMRAESSGLLDAFPNLVAYLERARARPAFQRAFEAQRDVFLQSQAAQ